MDYNNPTSLMPQFDWKPSGPLAGILFNNQQEMFNEQMDRAQRDQDLDYATKLNTYQNAMLDNPNLQQARDIRTMGNNLQMQMYNNGLEEQLMTGNKKLGIQQNMEKMTESEMKQMQAQGSFYVQANAEMQNAIQQAQALPDGVSGPQGQAIVQQAWEGIQQRGKQFNVNGLDKTPQWTPQVAVGLQRAADGYTKTVPFLQEMAKVKEQGENSLAVAKEHSRGQIESERLRIEGQKEIAESNKRNLARSPDVILTHIAEDVRAGRPIKPEDKIQLVAGVYQEKIDQLAKVAPDQVKEMLSNVGDPKYEGTRNALRQQAIADAAQRLQDVVDGVQKDRGAADIRQRITGVNAETDLNREGRGSRSSTTQQQIDNTGPDLMLGNVANPETITPPAPGEKKAVVSRTFDKSRAILNSMRNLTDADRLRIIAAADKNRLTDDELAAKLQGK